MTDEIAFIAATSGGLREALEGEADDDPLDHAGELLRALATGGPAEDMNDDADGCCRPPNLHPTAHLLVDRGNSGGEVERAWTRRGMIASMAMKILFTCRPLEGHYAPLVPLAEAARERGHTVAFATGAPVVDRAREAGFSAYPAGPSEAFRAEWSPRFPGYEQLMGDEQRHFFFTKIFAELELVPRADDLERIVGVWQPDLVVHEVAELAAPMVCTASGVPYVDAGFGPLVPRWLLRAAAAAAAPHWNARGLDVPPYAGLLRELYVDPCPPALQSDEITTVGAVQRIRPAVAPHPVANGPGRPARPLVYVTMGTVWNRNRDVFRMILAGMHHLDADVVVTVGRNNDPASLGVQPANVEVHRYVPQADLLGRCSVVVGHGGAGTTLGALAHGVPLLVVPQGADQWHNAERVVAAGAGLSLTVDELAPDTVARAVDGLLHDPAYRAAAQRIAAEIDAMPSASEAMAALEARFAR